MVRKIEVYIPDPVYERIRKITKKYGITLQDLLIRTLVKVIEEFEKVEQR